jgi:hypothetical protein
MTKKQKMAHAAGCECGSLALMSGSVDLFEHINHSKTLFSNCRDPCPPSQSFLRPVCSRGSTNATPLASDEGEELAIRVFFSGAVRLTHLCVKASARPELAPTVVRLFSNPREDLTVTDAATEAARPCSQQLALQPDTTGADLALRALKFNNVECLDLYFSRANDAHGLEIDYIGLKGVWSQLNRNPVEAVYEIRPVKADTKQHSDVAPRMGL